jgi:carbon-monoxide dehydrogenase large subunit
MRGDAVYTNTAPVDAYRGAGRPEATFVVERLVEVAARELGKDPAKFRRKNFINQFPHQTPVIMMYDAATTRLADEGAGDDRLQGASQAQADSARAGKLRGIGFSCYIEACGIAPCGGLARRRRRLVGSAEVRVNPVGTVEVLTGSHSHGQGHETTFAQLVADRLGIPIDNVSIVHGDTDKVQFGMGTYGSRSGAVGMSAIFKASTRSKAKGKKIAAHLLEADEADIEFEDGSSVKGTDASSISALRAAAYVAHKFNGQEPGLKETAFYDPTNFTFPAGVHICEVEIDPETGVTRSSASPPSTISAMSSTR